ncbi:Cyclin-T1-5 [Abeliophyllum distichum]|uniref:Cyclin-T1-5 n=1 Tax=Abeliophyllum distichum TaxID=126358 RepID=A0ABD1SUQ9_9LAMI
MADKPSISPADMYLQGEPHSFKPKWYFTREELDRSPSRKDGISREQESHLRQLFCSYLQELGVELKAPQVTIATAMMLCHRFFMHQSHTKNHWQTVANSSMFLASKAEDTPCRLKDIVVMSYKLMYRWDPSASQRIREREIYDKQKELILTGERILLVTVAFDLNIEHPYKPLVAALKKLKISHEVVKVAWNFVNDWVRTTLCLQYKPHYIAAGSLYLAVKFQKMKLPSENGNAWWMQFDISPKKLEEVIQHMLGLLGNNAKQALPSSVNGKSELKPVAGKGKSNSAESCISSDSVIRQDSSKISLANAGALPKAAIAECNQKQPCGDAHDTITNTEHCQISGSGSANSFVEECENELIMGDSGQKSACTIVSVEENYQKIDITMAPGSAESYISSGPVVGQDSRKIPLASVGVHSDSAIANHKQPSPDVNVTKTDQCRVDDSGSVNSVIEDGDHEPVTGDSGQKSGCKIVSVEESYRKIDVTRIRERIKRRKLESLTGKKSIGTMDKEIVDSEAWIERELEKDIELFSAHSEKRKRG